MTMNIRINRYLKHFFIFCLLSLTYFVKVNIVHANNHKFTRKFDPVVISGAELSPFLGKDIHKIRLYSVIIKDKRSIVQPIPFQIDERDENGNWIFNFDKYGNPVYLKRASLAAQDQLVFMAKDAGDRTKTDKLEFNEAQTIEIELTDTLNNSHAYVYLLYFNDTPPPISPVHYVQYDPVKDVVNAKLYEMGFSKKSPISYDYYVIPKSAGGEGINLFDRFKMRLDIDTSLVNIHRDESQFQSKLIGYIQGPVRIIRRVANSMYIALGFQSPAVLSDSIYYYDFFQFPTIVDIPIDLQRLYIVKKARLITSTDFNHNALGMKFYNSNNPKGLMITGKMSRAQEELNRAPYDWAVVSGPQGAWMNRVVMGKDIPFTKGLYFVDDKTKLDPPENEPGQIANTGYDFGNLLKAKKGIYTFTSYIYVPIKYKPGDEKPWLNIIDHPISYVIYYYDKKTSVNSKEQKN